MKTEKNKHQKEFKDYISIKLYIFKYDLNKLIKTIYTNEIHLFLISHHLHKNIIIKHA